jgi:aspartate carbamoyltransferase catalytic subunit
MSPRSSSISKGETLIDTAVTLNAMQPDLLVVRHASSGAASCCPEGHLLGDQRRRRPARAPDPGAARRAVHAPRLRGIWRPDGGDLRRRLHSRVARSNVSPAADAGRRVRLVGPPTLMPGRGRPLGRRGPPRHAQGPRRRDVVMMLRLQLERMDGVMVPSTARVFPLLRPGPREAGLAAPDAKVMHPGPMNRGVEIDSESPTTSRSA